MSLSILFTPSATMRKSGGVAQLAKNLMKSRVSVYALMASASKPPRETQELAGPDHGDDDVR